MDARCFLPFRYDPEENKFIPEFYTNMAQNVYISDSESLGAEKLEDLLIILNNKIEAIGESCGAQKGVTVIISDAEPTESYEMWLKPMGNISMNEGGQSD